MKKILLLLVAACCLFVSCEKEGGNSSVDGTTWKGTYENTNGSYIRVSLVLKDGFASLYNLDDNYLVDTQSYKVKGDKIIFNDVLSIRDFRTSSSVEEEYFQKEGTFNSDKSKLTLVWYYSYDYEYANPPHEKKTRSAEFTRVVSAE